MDIPARPSLAPIAHEIWAMKYRYSPDDGLGAEASIGLNSQESVTLPGRE